MEWHGLSVVITKVRAQGYVFSEGHILTGVTDCRAVPLDRYEASVASIGVNGPVRLFNGQAHPRNPGGVERLR